MLVTREQLLVFQKERVEELYRCLMSEELIQRAIEGFSGSQRREQIGAEYAFVAFSTAILGKGEHRERCQIGLLVKEESESYVVYPSLCFVLKARVKRGKITLPDDYDEELFELAGDYIGKVVPGELIPKKLDPTEGEEESKAFLNISKEQIDRRSMRIIACLGFPSREIFTSALVNLFNFSDPQRS